jgi:integrase
MASLELRNQKYRVVFMYSGRKFSYALDTRDKTTAEALRGGVEKTIMLIEQKVIRVPEGADIVAFVKSGGKVEEEPKPAPAPLTLGQLKVNYLQTHGQGAMEANSLATVRMHLGHFVGTLGERFAVRSLTLDDLQRHVNERRKKKYRGRQLSAVTLKKEVASFRAAWNWAALSGLVKGTFPSKGLVYPKTDEKPPFMTMAEIQRRITPSMNEAERDELWGCLYLTQEELPLLLNHVKQAAAHPWVYPLFCFVAHTGARRSEALRVLVQDVDFDSRTVLIREKKRTRKQRTTRRVPLTPFLASVLKEWLAVHPGGPSLFCQGGEVGRSRKRSRTTGHKGEKTRVSSLKGRLANVRKREAPAASAITKDEAHDHLKRTLAGSKWEVIPGWHCLRHSFISACASKGVDQRLIDEWTGHSTEEQRKRYRHLYPSTQQQAIASVFG